MMFAELTWDPLMHETGIPLAIMGMAVVFMALSILVLVITALPLVIGWAESKGTGGDANAKPLPNPVPAAATPPTESIALSSSDTSGDVSGTDAGLPPELIAVITAAVEFELGPVHIVRMRPLTASELAWTLEG